MRAAMVCAMFTAVARSQEAPPAPEPVFKFGTTVVATTGFRGQIYHIDADSPQLPTFLEVRRVDRALRLELAGTAQAWRPAPH